MAPRLTRALVPNRTTHHTKTDAIFTTFSISPWNETHFKRHWISKTDGMEVVEGSFVKLLERYRGRREFVFLHKGFTHTGHLPPECSCSLENEIEGHGEGCHGHSGISCCTCANPCAARHTIWSVLQKRLVKEESNRMCAGLRGSEDRTNPRAAPSLL